jgi:hypothetical protein
VPADPDVGQHRIADDSVGADVNCSPYCARKRAWLAASCGAMPTTRMPAAAISSCMSRIVQASLVQPAVKSAG